MSQILKCTSFTHVFLLLVSTTCLADTLKGKIVRIVDGDTLVVWDDNLSKNTIRYPRSAWWRRVRPCLGMSNGISRTTLSSGLC